MTTLAGEIAIVTGAGRGIGAETADALARAGAFVAVTARRLADAEGVSARIAAAGGKAMALACDVADTNSVAAAVRAVAGKAGPATILVNNAGTIEPIGRLHETDPDAWAKAVVANLTGAAHMARAVLPGMLAAGHGAIVNVSSGAAKRPLEGWSAYCASKAGLAMLTQSLGVRAYGFAPGVVDTGMQATIRASGINPVSRIPREALAPVADPARAIVFLASPDAARFAGSEIDIRDPEFRAACGLAPLAA
jgi:NAD(P)-dependent dehydrogenase (short-subunit alcohol dehydrogenase family)